MLGGEQSGHTIFRKYATTGDGQLTALQFLSLLHKSGKRASELVAGCRRYPQVLINVPVAGQAQKSAIMADPSIRDAVTAQEDAMAGTGRVLVRPSGTEALVRVMVEGTDSEQVDTLAKRVANVIESVV